MDLSALFVSPVEMRALSKTTRVIPVMAGKASSLPSFESLHVPGSVFFDMDLARDMSSEYPMMLPTSTQFAKLMTKLGIRPDDLLVVYDVFEIGIYFSPRVAWTCQYFGHNAVRVLNNFRRYVHEGFPIASGKLSPVASSPNQDYRVDFPIQQSVGLKVISFKELHDLLIDKDLVGKFQIIDARPRDQFHGAKGGTDDSPLTSGHMPGAINVPFSSILDADKVLLSALDLKTLFTNAGVVENLLTVISCNSGVTAAAVDLALRTSGLQMDTRLYDGSWSEWVKRADREVMTIVD